MPTAVVDKRGVYVIPAMQTEKLQQFIDGSIPMPVPFNRIVQQVFTPNYAAIYDIPAPRIFKLANSDKATRLVLCNNFDAARPETSCPLGKACKFVHADTRGIRNGVVHINYAWASPDAVTYERFPAGLPLAVAAPSSKNITDSMDSSMALKTKALDNTRRPLSHCAHYYFNRTCNLGPECQFIHAVFIDPNAKPHQRAPAPTQIGRPLRSDQERVDEAPLIQFADVKVGCVVAHCEQQQLPLTTTGASQLSRVAHFLPPAAAVRSDGTQQRCGTNDVASFAHLEHHVWPPASPPSNPPTSSFPLERRNSSAVFGASLTTVAPGSAGGHSAEDNYVPAEAWISCPCLPSPMVVGDGAMSDDMLHPTDFVNATPLAQTPNCATPRLADALTHGPLGGYPYVPLATGPLSVTSIGSFCGVEDLVAMQHRRSSGTASEGSSVNVGAANGGSSRAPTPSRVFRHDPYRQSPQSVSSVSPQAYVGAPSCFSTL